MRDLDMNKTDNINQVLCDPFNHYKNHHLMYLFFTFFSFIHSNNSINQVMMLMTVLLKNDHGEHEKRMSYEITF